MFNVIVGNDTIYSKHETGVFPNEQEIVEKLKKVAEDSSSDSHPRSGG